MSEEPEETEEDKKEWERICSMPREALRKELIDAGCEPDFLFLRVQFMIEDFQRAREAGKDE